MLFTELTDIKWFTYTYNKVCKKVFVNIRLYNKRVVFPSKRKFTFYFLSHCYFDLKQYYK